MTHTAPPPIPSFIPESAPFTPEQRAWLNGFFAGLLSLDGGITPLSRRSRGAAAGISGAPAARGRLMKTTRGALARSHHAAARADAACRQAAAAAAHDGGDGAAGLRPVRLQLRRLCQRHRAEERRAAQSLCAGRQGHDPDAQDALCRIRQLFLLRQKRRRSWRCRRRTRPPPSPIPEPAHRATGRSRCDFGSRTGSTSRDPRRRPGTSISISPTAGSPTRSAIRSASFRATIRRWSTPSSRPPARRRTSRSPIVRCATC